MIYIAVSYTHLTGVDKTSKRAATLTAIKHIKQLDLSDHKSLEFARDIFLFSFYMRGMSFIDLALSLIHISRI